MAARGRIPPALERRAVQAPELLRLRASHQPLDPLLRPDILENKIAVQAAELEQLAVDNRGLAADHMALKQDLVCAHEEVKRLKAHIRSTETESDIQIRVLLDKIARMESDIRASKDVKKNLKEVHMEVQNLVKTRQQLAIKIQEASQELQNVRADVKSLPDLHKELDYLRNDHKRLRATFEYEKSSNMEKVDLLKAKEQKLIGMVREVERLRAEILNAEKRAHAPCTHGGGYMGFDPSYPLAVHCGGSYVDAYGRHVQMGVGPAGEAVTPYGSSNGGDGGGSAASNNLHSVPNAGGVAAWAGGPHDPSLARR